MRWSLVLQFALGILLALIIAGAVLSYSQHRAGSRKLLQAIDTLGQQDPALTLMDSALVTLNEAENNFRLYTVAYEPGYLKAFSTALQQVSVMLDSITTPGAAHNRQLDELIRKKTEISDKIARLKRSTDQMLQHSLKDEMINRLLRSIPAYGINKVKKEAVVMDTLRENNQPKGKKGIFKRLGDALANKQDTVRSKQTIMVRTKDGKVMEQEQYEKHRLAGILSDVNAYYKNILRKQLQGRTEINLAEHSLAGANMTLLKDLETLLLSLKLQSQQEHEAQKQRAGIGAALGVDQQGRYMILILSAVFLLILALLWAAWRILRQQEQLRHAEQAATDQAKARTIFLTNMSHEIRTPLNSVIGFSEQLSHTPLQPEQQKILEAVEISADMLMDVVNDVLDFSKLENDHLTIQRNPFKLYQAFAEVASTMRVQASRKDLHFDVRFDGDQQLLVSGDVFRLKQILLNLIGNAIKYTDKGGVTVKARLERLQDRAQFSFSVSDTGPGISPDALPRIFERFYQARSPRLTVSRGAGLGLAITRRLVTLHGGDISVQSEVNKGSTFTCHLPYDIVTTPNTVVVTQRELEQPANRSLEGCYVLVADDQEMNLLLLKMILARWQCRFDLADDGAKAWELFRANDYDLVLLDLQMPHMSGIDVVERIRRYEDPEKAAVPVLALTADITHQDSAALRKAGFNDSLLKPFREKDIYGIIIRHLPASKTASHSEQSE